MKLRVLACGIPLFLVRSLSAQIFIGLGPAPGQSSSVALDLSMSGQVVVGGVGTIGLGDGWRWSQATGFESIGLPCSVRSVSDDGNVVAGNAQFTAGLAGFRWTTGIPTALPNLRGSSRPAPAISGDGLTVVGTNDASDGGVRWRADTGSVLLPESSPQPFPIIGTANPVFPLSTNTDGSIIVGSAYAFVQFNPPPADSQRANVPFRWTSAGGTQLIRPGGQLLTGAAYDMSSDGRYVLVSGTIFPQNNPPSTQLRWDSATDTYIVLTGLPGNVGNGFKISGDGHAVITSNFIWVEGVGTRTLTQVLTDAGCNFGGWTNLVTSGIDFNATHLCGYGTNPTGQTEAWYATIPAPTGVTLGAVGMMAISTSRRRRSVWG